MEPVEVEFEHNATLLPLGNHPSLVPLGGHRSLAKPLFSDLTGPESTNIGYPGSFPGPSDVASYDFSTNNQSALAFNFPGFCDTPANRDGDATPPVPYTSTAVPQGFDFSVLPHVNGTDQVVAPVHDYQLCESTQLSNEVQEVAPTLTISAQHYSPRDPAYTVPSAPAPAPIELPRLRGPTKRLASDLRGFYLMVVPGTPKNSVICLTISPDASMRISDP
ncbi:hypothetical protein BC834DRAFT_847446 [Gloeopeniophorella convolvens]|nr:hypothetical protein BC834DRAFT_847446 [Gloeopeniophorella convolvens]